MRARGQRRDRAGAQVRALGTCSWCREQQDRIGVLLVQGEPQVADVWCRDWRVVDGKGLPLRYLRRLQAQAQCVTSVSSGFGSAVALGCCSADR